MSVLHVPPGRSKRAENRGRCKISNLEHVKRRVRQTSRDKFAALVVELFSPFLPELFETHRLGTLDRLGTDVIDFEDEGDTRLVIQCKGFEEPNFEDKQQRQCLTEIAKYARVGPKTSAYWLVLNRPVKDRAHREAIEAALARLVANGKADEALLIDSTALIGRLRAVAVEQISNWAKERRDQAISDRGAHLGIVEYISEVPFRHDGAQSVDPSARFADLLDLERTQRPSTQFGKDRRPPRYLLTASFGFGKTSALLATAGLLLERDVHAIYMPATRLGDAAFVSGHGLITDILESLLPDDASLSDVTLSLAVDALRKELQSSDRWVLLLDAIDENPQANSASKLQALWGGIIDTGLPVLASVRSELSELRASEFLTHPTAQNRTMFNVAELIDWPDPLISEFLRRFAAGQGGATPASFADFQVLVDEGRYLETYGDIPRRPLFLGMLAEDAWVGRASTNRLSDLYGHYFERKFMRDRFGTGNKRPLRALEAHGIDEVLFAITRAMEEAAHVLSAKRARVLAGQAATMLYPGTISWEELDRILKLVPIPGVSVVELTSHSVLVPVARDALSRLSYFGFAHASFEDYFAARWFARHPDADPAGHLTTAGERFRLELTLTTPT